MSAMAVLEGLRARLAGSLPQAAVVAVHLLDLSDAQTGKWMVRLPGIYLTCEGIDARADDARLRLRLYVLARLADQRVHLGAQGWALAEAALAVVVSDAHVLRAQLLYRDRAGIDQPGIGLWEIAVERRHAVGAGDCGEDAPWRAETILASWAPWIGAAHEPKYERVTGDAPSVGNVDAEELLP
jgi:hypothetical protein